ncbi:uncharacterized protein J7T54_007408 [Emericellopsis cladophorae]|uniref:Glycoside hydrolase family 32 protein n=1 Tax=Emericellopsis cladophorae TaxID=2686198 RepID=A0A9Q0BAT5_9HYPO|nr:uncharacterized protein J7T54_007408 [Emericellopsis cladophorae]KAI6778011.1 hypothetical protein J7T54_007408 [Emericellopsis cladophorae]
MPYDDKGVFTGCFWPTGPRGEKDQLTVVYSSIVQLPIHWTIPYSRDCAGLAMATSRDGGQTWRKSPLNPILKGEPEGLIVTGFRDPFFAEWPALDQMRGEQCLYGVVSGGIVGQGPNAFVYAVSPDDLTTWSYLGPLSEIAVDAQRPTKWTGDLGLNWECVNVVTLETQDFLLMGTEGGQKRGHPSKHEVYAMWMAGTLEQTADGPRMQHAYNGLLDHGSFYAANSHLDPITGQRVVWGWIKEEELTLARREAKGWTGCLALPREVFLLKVPDVVGTLKTPLGEIESLRVSPEGIETLGIRPLKSLASLRRTQPKTITNIPGVFGRTRLPNPSSGSWELEAVVNVHQQHQRVGFYLNHDEDYHHKTSLHFSPQDEEVVVERETSNSEDDIVRNNVSGGFTLFVTEKNGVESTEKLHLRIFRDGDVLEIFANDRFALSTMVYANGADCINLSCFVEGAEADIVFESIAIWEDLDRVQF